MATRRTKRAEVMALAKHLGATVHLDVDSAHVLHARVEAPAGKVFAGTDLHELYGSVDFPREKDASGETWAERHVWGHFLVDMRRGVEDCDADDCEWCADDDEPAECCGIPLPLAVGKYGCANCEGAKATVTP